MNLHGSEVLVSRAFEASHSKIIWLYADLPLHSSLQCNTVGIAALGHYLFHCLFVQGCKAWLHRILAREPPLTGLCFDALDVNRSSGQQSLILLKDIQDSEINGVSSASTGFADTRKTANIFMK